MMLSCNIFLLTNLLCSWASFGQCSGGFDVDEKCDDDDTEQTCDFNTRTPGNDSGSTLFITPYLKNGRIKEAQDASRVDVCNLNSYSGYFTVDEKHRTNIFFWFFPNPNTSVPLLLWLNGGPGIASLFGLFIELGPFSVNIGLKLVPRKHAWTSTHSVLFMDPGKTGFSFSSGNITTAHQVGRDLYRALVQFFMLFPQFSRIPLYLTGESYGNKYIFLIANEILSRNPPVINLQGCAIGNIYLTYPKVMVGLYHNILYNQGLIGPEGRVVVKGFEGKILKQIKSREYTNAAKNFYKLIVGQNGTLYTNLTKYTNFNNVLYAQDPITKEMELAERFLSLPSTRRALHVGEHGQNFILNSNKVKQDTLGDLLKSVKPQFESVLSEKRVMLYSGNLDTISPPTITERLIEALFWRGKSAYERARRSAWYFQGQLAGFFQRGGNLTYVVVLDAGHRVPKDQLRRSLELITRFTRNQGF